MNSSFAIAILNNQRVNQHQSMANLRYAAKNKNKNLSWLVDHRFDTTRVTRLKDKFLPI